MGSILPRFISSPLVKLAYGILDICLNIGYFRAYVNDRFNRSEYIQIMGSLYKLTPNIIYTESVATDYVLNGVDGAVVLDIGGNNGCFTIPVSYRANHVYVVEPLYTDELQQNIVRNGINNVTILKVGLGCGTQRLTYHGKSETVACFPFSAIIDMCGGHIDFLKVDCEGAEWAITRDDLKLITRIEMELHGFNNEVMEDFLPRLTDFDYTIARHTATTWIIHAARKQRLRVL
jgi:FkbM family methyltransferase